MDLENIRKEAFNICLDVMDIVNKSNINNLFDLKYIQYRVKTKDSILRKMQKVGNSIDDVYDLIGIRYVFRNLNVSDIFCKNIINMKEFESIEIKDYLEKGHPEDSNYKALHIRLKYNNFPCEIQIMDINMSEHVTKTHDDYEKGLLKYE